MTVKIRNYRADDVQNIAELVRDAIKSAKFYTESEKAACASAFCDLQELNIRLRSTRTLVAELDGRTVGFGNLNVAFGCTACVTAELDCLYVSPEYQGRGIGRAIVAELEVLARQSAVTAIKVYAASIDAKQFFQALGYTSVRENSMLLGRQF